MEEELVKCETAILAKEVGFNIPVQDLFHPSSNKLLEGCHTLRFNHNSLPSLISRPSQSLLQKWLREVHDIDVLSISVRFTGYSEIDYYTYSILGESPLGKQRYKFSTYELALEVGLLKALTEIKFKLK